MITESILLQGARGTLGGMVARQTKSGTVLSVKPPKRGNSGATASQLAVQTKFTEAVIYAKAMIDDPDYQEYASRNRISSYNAALKDYAKPPVLKGLANNPIPLMTGETASIMLLVDAVTLTTFDWRYMVFADHLENLDPATDYTGDATNVLHVSQYVSELGSGADYWGLNDGLPVIDRKGYFSTDECNYTGGQSGSLTDPANWTTTELGFLPAAGQSIVICPRFENKAGRFIDFDPRLPADREEFLTFGDALAYLETKLA